MKPQIKVWHKCDSSNEPPKQVIVEPITGSAYSQYNNELYWFPTYKTCCHFYADEECSKELEFVKTSPQLILDKRTARRVRKIHRAFARAYNGKTRPYDITIQLLQRFVNAFKHKLRVIGTRYK